MTTDSTAFVRLLILDDTVEIANMIGELSSQAGFKATVTTDVDSFNLALERESPSAIVLDLQIPDTDGIEVLRFLSANGSKAGVLLVSGMDQRTVDSAERFGCKAGLNMLGSLRKPFSPEVLIKKLSSVRGATRQLTGVDLGTAIDDSAMTLHFQPVIRRLSEGVWHAESVEALPRWEHPTLGLLTPGQFLSLAGSERSNLMQRLTDFVLQRGIEHLQVWQRQGLHLGLRINITAGLIIDTGFPDRLENLISQYDTDPALLTLEINDSTALGNSRDSIEILTRLRLKEVNLSLDDFGAPGQALNTLSILPVNEIKIDRSITADLAKERGAPVLFRGLMDIARQLGIVCCAEGVETAKQLQLLDEMQCDLAQGYHIGQPVPSKKLPLEIATWSADIHPQTTNSAGK